MFLHKNIQQLRKFNPLLSFCSKRSNFLGTYGETVQQNSAFKICYVQESNFSYTSTPLLALDNHLQKVDGCNPKIGTNHLHTTSRSLFQADRHTTALALLDNVKQLPSSPKIALVLGAAGLLPFVACPYLMITSGTFLPALAVYQNFYGATILSFLGGVRWGLTLPPGSSQSPDLHNLGYSVVPQLWGFASLVAASYMDCVVVGSVGLIIGLGFTGYMDLAMWGYPAWFKGLRFCLTLGAILALWTGVMCKFLLNEEQKEEKKE